MLKKLFLLDAMALIYRAYYAMIKTPRVTSKGLNTSAILGFTNTLYEVLKNEKPTHIAVSFDTGAPTLRHADYDSYKANREATPEDIINSIPYIKKIIEAFNIPVIEMDGYEADDVIGTVAKKAEIEGFKVFMMTSDKDYGQLVSDNIVMYKPAKFGQKAEVVGVEGICQKYEILRPEQLIDILGLWGDASDNIPGVPGIGEVKAKKLISQFGVIENIYKHIEEVDNEKLKQTLIENQDKALMSKMLATIIVDVPVDIDFLQMKYDGPDEKKLREIFNELEFKALSQRIFTDLSLKDSANIPDKTSAPDLFSPVLQIVTDQYVAQPTEEIPTLESYPDLCHNPRGINSLEELITITSGTAPSTIFFDWITINEKIAGFSFAFDSETVFYHFLENENRHFLPLLKFLFENDNKIVTYQCKQSYKYFKLLKINVKASFFDLQIAHYLIQPENSHSIDRLAENYLHYAMRPYLPKGDGQPADSRNVLILNSCEMIEVFQRLYPVFKAELEKDNLFSLFENIEMPLAEVLADMENTGIKLDNAVLQENSSILNNDILNLESKIYELAGGEFNLASPKQLGEVLFNKLQIIENAKLTKTKQYQTGEEILNKLVNKHPVVPLILEWRTLSKLKSTYIDALPLLINPKTGKIHTTFNQTVTSTGRLSSVNPNLQNIPIRTERGRDVRKAFVASDNGSVILSADYSQIELRIVAAVCGDESMIETFKKNQDIHSTMASRVYKVPLNEVDSTMRRNAKTVNFGILYGISAFGLADRLHIPQKEARELISEYYNSFPKITEYLENTIHFAKEHGYVETLLARRRYIRDINSANAILRKAAERNAINAPIQGTAADLIKIAMIDIFRELKKRNLKSKMLLQVHDELVFEVPQNELDVMIKLVSELMSGAMQLTVPLSVEINYGKSWFDAH
jgi:DNA polymerase I